MHPGDDEECAYAGWELPGEEDFDEAGRDTCSARASRCDRAPTRSAATRGVADVAQFDDPFGNHHEFFYGADDRRVRRSRRPTAGSGFVTDGVGLGHALYVVPSCSDALDFFGRVMGFRVTDKFSWGPNGAVFMRSTPRHHSLAYIDLPIPGGPGLNHFMIEAKTLEDVGRAYDRAMDATVQHRQLARPAQQRSDAVVLRQSPVGLQRRARLEGPDGRRANWTVRTYTGRGEMWGHRGIFMDDIADAKVLLAPAPEPVENESDDELDRSDARRHPGCGWPRLRDRRVPRRVAATVDVTLVARPQHVDAIRPRPADDGASR